MWPKPLPNHWVMGMTIGCIRGMPRIISGSIHRGGSLEAKETYGNTNPPGRGLLRDRPPVLNSIRKVTSLDTGEDQARAIIGPTPIMELRSTTRAMCGLAGTAESWTPKCRKTEPALRRKQVNRAPMRTIQILKFLRMEIPDANRASVQEQGSNDTENLKGPAKMFIDPKTNELYVAMGMETDASSCSTPIPESTSGIGAPTA